ncbi:DNA polymerase III subunit delta [Rhizobium sp. TRM95111]|uniref:DNA polymerase III subunit delta n=1 Tax=Rhizobium alarense TaxID=2846851 RepID=UPI001F3ACC86|nr:DNA polymerase III subunit delta [Rhizobium alarense]MCF3639976.1 DNA polymerase III subunit delta [Rhizobium alarense]
MAVVKPHEFDSFLRTSAASLRLFLVYGPDRGLVSERAAQLAAASKVPLDDPFSTLKIDAGEIGSHAGRILDEVNAIGLFGGDRLVWIKGAAGEKGVSDALEQLAGEPPDASWLIVEAGDLKKTAAVRKVAESARSVAAIACYPDDERSLNALIDAELGRESLRITPEARARLLEVIGGDRIASRNEVRKLALYCRDEGRIDVQHVDEIIGDASAISVDEAVDAVLKGDKDGFLHAIQKIVASKTAVFLVLQAVLRQFQLLDLMRAEMDEKRLPAGQVMQTHGRHLHFRRKPLIESALRAWDAAGIRQELERLTGAILRSRRQAALEPAIAMQTLLATVLRSARR